MPLPASHEQIPSMPSRSPALLDRLYPQTLTNNDRPQAQRQNRTWKRDISSWQQPAAPQSLAIQDRDRQRQSRHAGLLAEITYAQSRGTTDQAGSGTALVSHTASMTITNTNPTAMIRPHGHLTEGERSIVVTLGPMLPVPSLLLVVHGESQMVEITIWLIGRLLLPTPHHFNYAQMQVPLTAIAVVPE
ncbi:uncharacterized protein A1O5_11945 [Cladophialophora psammophila CBS 110553]|uniref:Uncharacterized protein n=1 Tax=Cladophialophora psammophila CBS 110553 TaxID=1182543 RepID=W9VZN8_9EURO|nr:uncharacterized protein A1O5_11945 [Cladophialophora psammophila CBS 110553]EXJ61153.1 hypothetical protein A1O5_11945 [Cladophialophora psammophila CBS 110553]